MKRALATLLALFTASSSAEPNILGRWKSDGIRSAAFNRQNAKLEERSLVFLDQLLGHAVVVITPSHVLIEMPDVSVVTKEGKTSVLKGFREEHPYRLLSVTSTQAAIEGTQPVTGTRVISVYTFEDPDTMWVYLAGPGFEHLHAREYFVRIR